MCFENILHQLILFQHYQQVLYLVHIVELRLLQHFCGASQIKPFLLLGIQSLVNKLQGGFIKTTIANLSLNLLRRIGLKFSRIKGIVFVFRHYIMPTRQDKANTKKTIIMC